MADITAWHGKTLQEHVTLRDAAAKNGYRFLSLSIYGDTGSPIYAAVMIKRATIVAQRDFPAMTADQFQSTFNAQAALGYGPVMLAATGSSSSPLFAAVFQPMSPIPLTRHLLTSGDPKDTSTIQGMNAQAKKQGLIPHSIATYGDPGDPRFAVIWFPNTAKTFWNNDGLVDDAGTYQARFDAETSAWCRPAFVTVDNSHHFMSLFVDNEVGDWVARHNISPDDYQTEFNKWTGQGFFPINVQAGGTDAVSARFAALFVKTESTVARQFHANGPVANAAIDAVLQKAMTNSPVRHAALAIVHGKKLVYARGYTFAEPDWPQAQPTHHFRMASDSKVVTSLAIFQLIEAGNLHLSDTVQSILQLKTPSGSGPSDSHFGSITIQQLLEHTSGLQADSFRNNFAVKQAFDAAGHPVNLPVTPAQTDSYIAGLSLVAPPGTSHYYNNCGYYLLSRVVAQKRGLSMIDAYQNFLFDPLKITRIRLATSLLSVTPSDEARYQSPDLGVGQSVMTPARPLVPYLYGTEDLEILSGAGGLSGAVTDLARLIAMLIDSSDTPAMKRTTVTSMLEKGAQYLQFLSTPAGMALLAQGKALTGDGGARSGYGFDAVSDNGNGNFYAQKGGDLPDLCNSVVQFNNDWGFVMCWATPPTAGGTWYPDFPDVMNIAITASWSATDLFPSFGMPSL
jgi:CubicO group peptidase (beta-lactamase class C family)